MDMTLFLFHSRALSASLEKIYRVRNDMAEVIILASLVRDQAIKNGYWKLMEAMTVRFALYVQEGAIIGKR